MDNTRFLGEGVYFPERFNKKPPRDLGHHSKFRVLMRKHRPKPQGIMPWGPHLLRKKRPSNCTCLDVTTWKVQSNHQPYLHCEFKILETARNNFKNSLLQTKLLLSVLHNFTHQASSSRFTSLTHVALQKRSMPSRCTRGPHVPPATIHSSTLAWKILQDFAGRNSLRFGYSPKAGEIIRNSIKQHRQCLASVPVFAALKRPTKTPTSVAL